MICRSFKDNAGTVTAGNASSIRYLLAIFIYKPCGLLLFVWITSVCLCDAYPFVLHGAVMVLLH
jgi:hypothetical protein